MARLRPIEIYALLTRDDSLCDERKPSDWVIYDLEEINTTGQRFREQRYRSDIGEFEKICKNPSHVLNVRFRYSNRVGRVLRRKYEETWLAVAAVIFVQFSECLSALWTYMLFKDRDPNSAALIMQKIGAMTFVEWGLPGRERLFGQIVKELVRLPTYSYTDFREDDYNNTQKRIIKMENGLLRDLGISPKDLMIHFVDRIIGNLRRLGSENVGQVFPQIENDLRTISFLLYDNKLFMSGQFKDFHKTIKKLIELYRNLGGPEKFSQIIPKIEENIRKAKDQLK